MSTVVFHNGSLYADTQCTHSKTVGLDSEKQDRIIVKTTTTRKIFRLKENCCNLGAILGYVGDVSAITHFMNWSNNNRRAELNYTFRSAFNAVEYDGETITLWKTIPIGKRWIKIKWWLWDRLDVYKFVIYEEHKYTTQDQLYGRTVSVSLGSGINYATDYLSAKGSNPIDAIVVAAKHDPYTNDTVEAVGLFVDEVAVVRTSS